MKLICFVSCILLCIDSTCVSQNTQPPHLSKSGQLIIDGKPFLILGGELGNSTASHLESMSAHWPTFTTLNMNTVLAPVYWDLIEPREGEFDFSLVDGLIKQARKNKIRLVLLWFGTWKNSMSCYAPEWVKRDVERFPRCQDKTGQGMEILTPFSDENLKADVSALAALMRHLRKVDSDQHTVIMLQVENEIGMIPLARDHSKRASEKFAEEVPTELIKYLQDHEVSLNKDFLKQWQQTNKQTKGNWETCFGSGPSAEELFMAWHFAKYVEKVTAAGKAEHPLPMYLNAALIRPNYAPGQYPSAGPLPHLIDVWRAGAPSIDFLAPDIYFPNVAEWCDRYAEAERLLFIPEIGLNDRTATNALYAIGQHDAIGFSPFAIESMNDPAIHNLRKSYAMITELLPLIHEHHGRDSMVGAAPRVPFDEKDPTTKQTVDIGGYQLSVTFEATSPWGPPGPPQPSGGIIISTGADEFIVAGTGLVVTFKSEKDGELVGIANIQEGHFVNGKWEGGLWLNGDQSHQGRHLRIPAGEWSIQRVRVYRYQ